VQAALRIHCGILVFASSLFVIENSRSNW